MTRILKFLAILILAAAAGCGALAPHRIEIQQGNYISPEMAGQLKLGMTKHQVRFLLGTPLLADVFHAERWDYLFYRDARQGSVEQRKLSVYFQDGKLVKLAGDVVPAAPQAVEKVN